MHSSSKGFEPAEDIQFLSEEAKKGQRENLN